MTFRKEDRERVARGEITVSFRLWQSARVRAGRQYETGFGRIDIHDVQLIPAAMVTEEDIALSGCADLAGVWSSAGEHTGTTVGPDTLLYRVCFAFLG